MAFCLNRVQLIGHVGKPPKIHRLQNGNEVAHFSVATSEGWVDKRSGEKIERTEWHEIVVWAPGLVKMCKNNVKKGTRLFVEGKLGTRKWTAQDGQERSRVEVTIQAYSGQIILLGANAREPGEGEAGGGDSGSWSQPATSFGEAGGFDTGGGFEAPDTPKIDDRVPF